MQLPASASFKCATADKTGMGVICRGYIGIMEKTVEATILYRGYLGILGSTEHAMLWPY